MYGPGRCWPATGMSPHGIYTMPFAFFREPAAESSEYAHTTRYYRALQAANELHYNQILHRVFVGTCPRTSTHLERLKQEAGISDVMNFQTREDILYNYPDHTVTPECSPRAPRAAHHLREESCCLLRRNGRA